MFRQVSHTLSATTGWSHPCFLLAACHVNLHQPNHSLYNSSPHLCVQWSDGKDFLGPSTVPDATPHLWIRALASKVLEIQSILPRMQSIGWYNLRDPVHLLTSRSSLSLCDTTQIQRLHYLLRHEGSILLTLPPPPLPTRLTS